MGNKIAEKLDKMVASMREELGKHDGSTIQTIYSNAKEGFASIKCSLSRSEKANKLADDIKKLGEDFVGAIKAGDKKLSAKILNGLEKKTKEYKKEKSDAEKAASTVKTAKPKPAAKPKALAEKSKADVKPEAADAPKAKAVARPKTKAAAKPKAAPKAAGKSKSDTMSE